MVSSSYTVTPGCTAHQHSLINVFHSDIRSGGVGSESRMYVPRARDRVILLNGAVIPIFASTNKSREETASDTSIVLLTLKSGTNVNFNSCDD